VQEPPPLSPRERIIVACDCNTEQELSTIVADLAEFVGTFKIGLELITSVGLVRAAELVRMLGGPHVRIMVDGKYCDIPNTMKASIRNVDAVRGDTFTIHANVGPAQNPENGHAPRISIPPLHRAYEYKTAQAPS
jgi:orotidine-5'-phosphate decarboxylase